jgi:N-acetylmuramoyl-L-alanine amidase
MFMVTAPLLAAIKHTVKAGESLFIISKKYGTTVNALKRDNGLKKDTIYPGQVLRISNGVISSRSSGTSISEDDIYWLSRAVYGEARGESYEGQVAVAAVILNRLEDSKFPNTIKGVIFEPLAFTAVADGQIYYTPSVTAIKAARDAINGWDPSAGALYYWNPVKATSKWIWSRPIIKQIGNHVFAS